MNRRIAIICLLLTIIVGMASNCDKKVEPEKKSLDAPTGLSLHSATTNSLTFQWSQVAGAASYEWKLLQGAAQIQTGTVAKRNVVIEELTAGTGYSFAVRAKADDVVSEWSASVAASTLEDETPDPGPEPGGETMDYSEFKMPAGEEDGAVRAFPGAEGCGMFTTGGRGGKVYHVTSLEDSGNGTLRWALGQKGARTIVFDVAGRIRLKSTLKIANGDVTIAGQTAPGDGICISDYSVQNNASNVIIRFVRFRLGDEGALDLKATMTEAQWNALSSIPMEDCIWGRDKSDIILDHCSMSWCIDEVASFYDNDRFTMQYCIVAESMNNSFHPKGSHGYGGIWGGHGASFAHNLIAHNTSRTPRLCGSRYTGKPENEKVEIVNNVFYNWGPTNGGYAGEGGSFNFINNYYKPGPSTATKKSIVNRIVSPNADDGNNANAKGTWGSFYLNGNWFDTGCADLTAAEKTLCENVNADNWVGLQPNGSAPASVRSEQAFDISVNGSATKTQSAAEAYAGVLARAGASLRRDAVDARIVDEVSNGTALGGTKGIIDSQSQVGGWPAYGATEEEISAAATDSDADGIPDWFETLAGLNKTNAADGNAKTLDKYGRYTNLEMYLHYLVRDIL